MSREKVMAPFTVRLTKAEKETLEDLSDLLKLGQADVLRLGLRQLAHHSQLAVVRADRLFGELLDEHGSDARLELNVLDPPDVRLLIDGEPTERLRAVSWPVAAYWTPSSEAPAFDLELPVTVWPPGSGIRFDVGRHPSGAVVRMPLAELRERLVLREEPPTAEEMRIDRELRGQQPDDDLDDDLT